MARDLNVELLYPAVLRESFLLPWVQFVLAVAGIEPGTTGWAARTLPLRYIILLLSLELTSGTFLIPDL